MLIDLYIFGDSPLHRVRPSIKIAALILVCTLLFILEGWITVAFGAGLVALCIALSGLHVRHVIAALQPALWILFAIFAVQTYLVDISFASFVVSRFILMILAATVVTATTRTSEIVDGILAGFKFAPVWVPKEHIALSVSLCLRFIPIVLSVFHDVRQAQRARGLDRNLTALLVPLIVRTLRSADEVSYAVYSRSFN